MILIKITHYSYFKFLPKNKIFHLLYWTTLSPKIGIHAITLCQMTITSINAYQKVQMLAD